MAETPQRNIRISDDIWEAAMTRASRDRVPLSLVIRQFLIRYADNNTQIGESK